MSVSVSVSVSVMSVSVSAGLCDVVAVCLDEPAYC